MIFRNFPRRIFEDGGDAGGGPKFETPPYVFANMLGGYNFLRFVINFFVNVHEIVFDNFINGSF